MYSLFGGFSTQKKNRIGMNGFTQSSYPVISLRPSDEDYKTPIFDFHCKGTTKFVCEQIYVPYFYILADNIELPVRHRSPCG